MLIDPATLATLPPRGFRAGMAEVIQYGVIGHPQLHRRPGGGRLNRREKGPAVRIYIGFEPSAGRLWGWNGSTFG